MLVLALIWLFFIFLFFTFMAISHTINYYCKQSGSNLANKIPVYMCSFQFLPTIIAYPRSVSWRLDITQTEVGCTCSVVKCALQVHCYPNSVAGVCTAHAVAVYTAQFMQPYVQSTLQLTCSYTACTPHFGLSTNKFQCKSK